MSWIERLVRHRRNPVARQVLLLLGLEVHPGTVIGRDLRVLHRGIATVIHPDTVIGDRVTIYHQVTIGRADAHVPRDASPMERIEIGDDVVLFPGAKVLGGAGITRIGRGTLVAANAVVTRSTGEWEVWGGVPARRIGARTPP
jgi:serine O-acetyltransferase